MSVGLNGAVGIKVGGFVEHECFPIGIGLCKVLNMGRGNRDCGLVSNSVPLNFG